MLLPAARARVDAKTYKTGDCKTVFAFYTPQIDDQFSWFDYRSRGFEDQPKRGLRIDLIMVSPALKPRLLNAGIDYQLRGMEKPSDHAPIWLELQA